MHGLLNYPSGNQHTAVVFILDCSSSMYPIKDQAISHFNECVSALSAFKAKNAGTTSVSLLTFNSIVAPVFWDRSIDTIEPITDAQYRPSGTTALNDAIGLAIQRMEEQYSDRANVAFLFNIVTDGYENASRSFNNDGIRRMISQRKERGNWTFTFAGANVDMNVMAQTYDIPVGNTQTFAANAAGFSGMTVNSSRGFSNYASARAAGGQSMGSFYKKDNEDDEGNVTDREI